MLQQRVLPLPPLEYRGLVSPVTDDSYYDNPSGDYIWGPLNIAPLTAGEAYRKILDFGCGCGREVRRLMLQNAPPEEIVGVDISRKMIDWCSANLGCPGVSFQHHDVWNIWYAPDNHRNRVMPLTPAGSDFSLIEANSVFTHLLEDQSTFYLEEMSGMLAPKGLIRATWFFINKKAFPMMMEAQNTVFIDETDLTKAVFYDWEFFVRTTRRLGYKIVNVEWADMLGFHNTVYLGRDECFTELDIAAPPSTSCLGF
ncbi:MAG TPA: class I SAM-dependent methyltransferase [Paludibaculum sp.]|jgi:SAM-dependent methyltransferase